MTKAQMSLSMTTLLGTMARRGPVNKAWTSAVAEGIAHTPSYPVAQVRAELRPSLHALSAVVGTCDQTRPCWDDRASKRPVDHTFQQPDGSPTGFAESALEHEYWRSAARRLG